MMHENQNYEYHTNNTMGVLIGMLLGGLAGAVTMLLLAPQSGKDTRMQIKEKSIQLRDRTSELVEDTLAQVRTGAQKVQKYGQQLASEQLGNVSEAAQAAKKALEQA